LLAHVRWFSSASSTTKTGCHDIAEILLKVALNTKNQINIGTKKTLTEYICYSGFTGDTGSAKGI
jgi:hypothetical protein